MAEDKNKISNIGNDKVENGSSQHVCQPSAENLKKLQEKYTEAKQEQVFTFYDSLGPNEQVALFNQLSFIDPNYINDISQRALSPKQDQKNELLEPIPESASASLIDSKADEVKQWYDMGLDLIAQNKIAVVLMAGGQGTRLGSSAPKGCFNIGLPSGKSLFQLQAERIQKIQQLARRKTRNQETDTEVTIPWYIMTSGPTRQQTEEFFANQNYFGLNKENVTIFEQGVLPCLSIEGKILLESKGKVAVAPDGNGGIYQALIKSNIISDMSKRGIQHIHAYCVDNCLVKVADPVFIGFSASKKVDIATKVVRKRNISESVGLIVLKNGSPGVVEYSELDQEVATATDAHQPDTLKFRAANIVNHYYSFKFLETIPRWAHSLSFHVARKKISHVDTLTGAIIKPEKPNGIKLEQFVFDCFSQLDLKQFACLEVKREDEFSPLKNAKGTGEDDADTSKQDILRQGQRWAQAAGAILAPEIQAKGLEISPLISYVSFLLTLFP